MLRLELALVFVFLTGAGPDLSKKYVKKYVSNVIKKNAMVPYKIAHHSTRVNRLCPCLNPTYLAVSSRALYCSLSEKPGVQRRRPASVAAKQFLIGETLERKTTRLSTRFALGEPVWLPEDPRIGRSRERLTGPIFFLAVSETGLLARTRVHWRRHEAHARRGVDQRPRML